MYMKLINIMSEPYFVFCKYDSVFPHRMIFIPLNKLDEKDKFMQKINNIINLGPFIIEYYVKESENMSNLDGFYIHNELDKSPETRELCGYWAYLSDIDDLEGSAIPSNIHNDIFMYYVNDKNRSLSPKDLYDTISGMTEYEGHKFCVKECVMVADRPITKGLPSTLRLFVESEKNMTLDEIKNLLLTDERIKSVDISKLNLSSSWSWGYLTLQDKKYEDDFADKTLSGDGLKIIVDRG